MWCTCPRLLYNCKAIQNAEPVLHRQIAFVALVMVSRDGMHGLDLQPSQQAHALKTHQSFRDLSR